MKPNETPPEMVWIGGRWLLKSAVDKVNAEKEEARRAMLANQQPRQHVARAVPKAELQEPSAKCQEPSGGPAGSPSQHPAPGASCFMGPMGPMGRMGPMADAPTDLQSQGLRSDLIKVEAEKAEPESGEATKAAGDPENAGLPAEGPRDPVLSDLIKDEAKEAAEPESGEAPKGACDPGNSCLPAGGPRDPVLSDLIKATAEPSQARESESSTASCFMGPMGPMGKGRMGPMADAPTDLQPQGLRSDPIKVEAEKAEPESGEATEAARNPGKAQHSCLCSPPLHLIRPNQAKRRNGGAKKWRSHPAGMQSGKRWNPFGGSQRPHLIRPNQG